MGKDYNCGHWEKWYTWKVTQGRNVSVKGGTEISNLSEEAIVVVWTKVQALGKKIIHEHVSISWPSRAWLERTFRDMASGQPTE